VSGLLYFLERIELQRDQVVQEYLSVVQLRSEVGISLPSFLTFNSKITLNMQNIKESEA
jgi:hypothetical protein